MGIVYHFRVSTKGIGMAHQDGNLCGSVEGLTTVEQALAWAHEHTARGYTPLRVYEDGALRYDEQGIARAVEATKQS